MSRKNILLVVASIQIILFTIIGIMTYECAIYINNCYNWVNHTNLVIGKISICKENYSQTIYGAYRKIILNEDFIFDHSSVSYCLELSKLTKDNSKQSNRFITLKSLIIEEFKQLEKAVASNSGLQVITQKEYIVRNSLIDNTFNDAILEEQDLLSNRILNYQQTYYYIVILFISLSVLFLLSIGFKIYLFGNINDELMMKTIKLEQTNKELEQFAYIASHDLKAPLRAISNLVTWINEDSKEKLGEEQQKYMKLLINRVNRMENLINGILQYSRVGRVYLDKEFIDLNILVDEIVEEMVPSNFKVNIDKKLPKIYGNKVCIHQLFGNLISNCVKHHDKNEGNIWIKYIDHGKYYEFSIIDDGPGIPVEFHKKLFQIFQTLKPKDEKEGTGIGLALVKKVLDTENEIIYIKSEGRGVEFVFTWRKYG